MHTGKEGEIDMFDRNKVEEAVKLLLEGIGEDVTREGLIDTPKRVQKLREILSEWNRIQRTLSRTFHCDNNDMVVEKDITFFSSCNII